MNCVYFACSCCHKYIDAGYRWAYWKLEEPAIVQQPEVVILHRVLSAKEYWEIDNTPQSAWLREGVLPKVRIFLLEHQDHSIAYVDEMWIDSREEKGETWSEIETY
jgi:hypothetical protein